MCQTSGEFFHEWEGRRRSGCHEQNRVIGGHTAIRVCSVEGDTYGITQGSIQRFSFHASIGGDDNQHGGQSRGEHASTLGHSTNGVTEAIGVDR